MRHIKTPIKSGRLLPIILDSDGDQVASILGQNAHQQTEEIVQAVNDHDDLVAQRIALLAVCKALLGIVQGRKELREKWPHCIEKARVAIALAEDRFRL